MKERDDALETELDLDDDDLDSEHEKQKEKPDDEDTKLGSQDDGSVVVELDEGTENHESVEVSTETDEELSAKREARRQERQERKARQKEQQQRVQRELQAEREARRQLEERLAAVERKSTGAEMAQLENAERQTTQAYNFFKEQIRLGQESGNGSQVADATEKMMLAGQRMQQLANVKRAYQQRQSAPAPLDERLVTHANGFMSKHSWYKPEGRDNDSVVLRALDNQIAQEGWDPTTEAYWQELDTRLKKYLPHRSKSAKVQSTDDDDQVGRNKPKSIVAGSGRDAQTSVSAKSVFRLSPERVAALKEAGMWDDPKQRTEAIKRYRDFDKQQKGR